MKTNDFLRCSLLNEAAASDLVLRYGLHKLTAAAILAASHARGLEAMASEARWQGWVHHEDESEANRAAEEYEALAEQYRAYAEANGTGYMLKEA